MQYKKWIERVKLLDNHVFGDFFKHSWDDVEVCRDYYEYGLTPQQCVYVFDGNFSQHFKGTGRKIIRSERQKVINQNMLKLI